MEKQLIVLVDDDTGYLEKLASRIRAEYSVVDVQTFVGSETNEDDLTTHCFAYDPVLIVCSMPFGKIEGGLSDAECFLDEVAALFSVIVLVDNHDDMDEAQSILDSYDCVGTEVAEEVKKVFGVNKVRMHYVVFRDDPDLMVKIARAMGIESNLDDDSRVH